MKNEKMTVNEKMHKAVNLVEYVGKELKYAKFWMIWNGAFSVLNFYNTCVFLTSNSLILGAVFAILTYLTYRAMWGEVRFYGAVNPVYVNVNAQVTKTAQTIYMQEFINDLKEGKL